MDTFKLDLGNLQIELSDEKLYIKTFTSNETFALRTINGIGVIDLIELYEKKLGSWAIKRFLYISCFLVPACKLFQVLFSLEGIPAREDISVFIFFSLLGLFLVFINKKPKLLSAVRIMLNSGNRDFEFDKTGIDGEAVAEFVAKVESTLTSYNKI